VPLFVLDENPKPLREKGFAMTRFLVTIDELAALVRARTALTDADQQEFADTLGAMLSESALDLSVCE
jgi:hypothetical protein